MTQITDTAETTATFAKLRDGSWGLRVVGCCHPGSYVQVTKKSGETTLKQIGRVMWHDAKTSTALVTIAA